MGVGETGSFVAYLVRHAAFDGMQERLAGRSDVAINREGRAQCAALATDLAERGIRALHASPQRRAQETAAVLASSLKLPVQIATEFDEIDFGVWAGRAFAELAPDPAWQRFNAARDTADIPGGETLDQVSDRVQRGLTHIRHAPGPAVVVTHAEIVRAAVLLATGRSWRAWGEVTIAPASVTRLVFDRRWRL